MKPRHVVALTLLAAWTGLGVWSGPQLAGGAYLLTHKTDPREATRETWAAYWDERSTDPKERKRLQGCVGTVVVFFAGVPLCLALAGSGRRRSLHGNARWATRQEVRSAGLLATHGVILGKLGTDFLMMDEPKFVMLCAPTRSGKGVGTIIPNLLNFADSVIVVDIKGENFEVTSGFRAAHGQQVFRFAPFDERFETHCCNPLSYVNRDRRFVVGDLQGKGYMLYPRRDGTEGFFNDQARNLFVGISLYCIESGLPLTIGEVLRRSHGDGRPREFWQTVVDERLTADRLEELSEDCLNALRQFVSNSDNTLTSILSTFNAPLGIFANPMVDAATSRDDFDLRDVRRRRMSIYVVVPPNRLDDAALLVNLFFSIAIDENTRKLPEQDQTLNVKCLLVLDEFPALGRVDKYVKAIGYIAGYGLRVLTIAQSQAQLQDDRLYGDEGTRTLVANHLVQIFYAPREQKDAQEYSEVLGYATEPGISKGTSRGAKSFTRSENISEQKRALMLPQELREMGAERVIVLSDNCKPIFAEKICYHTDPAFTSRLHPPVKVPALRLDLHMARREGRIRALQADEPIEPSAIVVDESSRPTITSPQRPIPAEVAAMADWLFASVRWGDSDTDTHGASLDGSPDPTQQIPQAAARHREPSPSRTWR
jgi:type IV secretion system protein VirD4